MINDLIPIKVAAEICGKGITLLHYHVRKGHIPTATQYQTAGRVYRLVHKKDVLKFAEKQGWIVHETEQA